MNDSNAFIRIFKGIMPREKQETQAGRLVLDLPLGESLGIKLNQANLVTDLREGCAAHAAGILRGDLIVEVDGRPTLGEDDAKDALKRPPAGWQNKRQVVVMRSGSAQQAPRSWTRSSKKRRCTP